MNVSDLFGGGGGYTISAKSAGLRVVFAANHDPRAVQYYRLNHPEVDCQIQDLRQMDWGQMPRPDVLLASPSCKGHSLGRGKDKPHHDTERQTAWAVIDCTEYHRPQMVIIENVKQFLIWPLFKHWIACMETLGYAYQYGVTDLADFGIPQNRERAFVILKHRKAGRLHPIHFGKGGHVPVRSILDLNSGQWSKIKDKCPKTRARIARARAEGFGECFVFPYYSSGSGLTGRSLDRPVGTITTGDRWAIARGDEMRMFSLDEYRRAMGFPDDYILPTRKDHALPLLGNAVSPAQGRAVIRKALAQL